MCLLRRFVHVGYVDPISADELEYLMRVHGKDVETRDFFNNSFFVYYFRRDVGKMARVYINHRILTCDCREMEVSGDPGINLSDDTVFQFLSEEFDSASPMSSIDGNDEEEDEMNDVADGNRRAENHQFWETQHQMLQSIIRRTTPLESRIRTLTKEALKQAESSSGGICACGVGGSCRKCLMEEICRHLQKAGFDSAICKSKWRSSPDIPSGEHTFLDVIDRSNPKRDVRVIVELNFRAEFEMARASKEYEKVVKSLPETYVGKIERLLELVKVVCAAAKKCLKEKKVHMAPWRKHRYMQAKWLRIRERIAASPRPVPCSGRPARPTISMLTVDLMETSNLRSTAVAVV